ncbi:TIR domain-containing protein [Methanochimaera problematica]|uniref:TIR domain-containing protein n=1 Tax=Methanochimaera problematica TaxID=2609417 RepID=UPI002938D26D|nr:TIR domain-containing protein [Methanoplanus sp. FWC-SCC4]
MSYHHANDQAYRNKFEEILRDSEISILKSVQLGDIDENLKTETIRQKIRDDYLSDSTVTIVLIGTETWKRKHVDWEIGSSIRHTEKNSRSGLLGIILPSYPSYKENKYNPYTIPPRLNDNLECDYAKIYPWNDNPQILKEWIHDAYNRRFKANPNNVRPSFGQNRSGDRWFD